MNRDHNILLSTSLFFDPSIVELFCAAFIGAELIIPIFKENQYQLLAKLIENISLNFLQVSLIVKYILF